MIRPELLKNMQITPEALEQMEAAPGEHAEIPRGPVVPPGQQRNDRGDLLVPTHEWRESVTEDHSVEDDDEPEAS